MGYMGGDYGVRLPYPAYHEPTPKTLGKKVAYSCRFRGFLLHKCKEILRRNSGLCVEIVPKLYQFVPRDQERCSAIFLFISACLSAKARL